MSTHETAKARECHLRKRVKEIAWQSTAKGWEWAEKQMLDVLREATQREAAARLEEAKWWRHRMPRIEHGLMEPCRCDQCHRIAELERQASGQADDNT